MKVLIDSFINHYNNRGWNLDTKKSLIAVSGGLDSMVLAYLFEELQFKFEICHCNFKLRDSESDADEDFILKYFKQRNIIVHIKSFDTVLFAKQQKISIQESARILRYDWFDDLVETHGFEYIVTAHHLNDSIETLIYNFTKGCGIEGLTGIPVQNGKIIRPLLFAKRTELEDFAQSYSIPFREDSSNSETKYNRNKIRLNIIPLLKTINPSFEKVAAKNIERLKETAGIFREAIEGKKKQLVSENEKHLIVDLDLLNKEQFPKTVLYELIKDHGFNNTQVTQILISAGGLPGKLFYSPSHILELARGQLILSRITEPTEEHFVFEESISTINLIDEQLEQKIFDVQNISFTDDKSTALLDLNLLKYPLIIRRWKPGDVFQPLGMKGQHQSLQDFFTHQKISRTLKKSIWVMESGGEIAWVVGYRIDERFKIGPKTKKAVRFTYSG